MATTTGRFGTCVLALVVLLGALLFSGPVAVSAVERTPRRTILIVVANLREGKPFAPDDIRPRYGDLERMNEVKNFARRLRNKLQQVPDVLLLQEVLQKSSKYAAEKLTNQFDTPFRSIIASEHFFPKGGNTNPKIVHETGIVINQRTMDATPKIGFLHTAQLRSDPPEGAKAVSKGNAYALLREEGSGATFAVMSTHLVMRDAFASYDVAKVRREEWVNYMTNFLNNGFPNADAHVLGGDFNETRCIEPPERVECTINQFWNTLSNSKLYTDAVFARHSSSDEELAAQTDKRIDYVFTDATVDLASHDSSYHRKIGEPGFISDHRYIKAQLSLP